MEVTGTVSGAGVAESGETVFPEVLTSTEIDAPVGRISSRHVIKPVEISTGS
jgi:hypothetical protein